MLEQHLICSDPIPPFGSGSIHQSARAGARNLSEETINECAISKWSPLTDRGVLSLRWSLTVLSILEEFLTDNRTRHQSAPVAWTAQESVRSLLTSIRGRTFSPLNKISMFVKVCDAGLTCHGCFPIALFATFRATYYKLLN